MNSSSEDSIPAQVLGSALIGAVIGPIAFFVIAILGIRKEIALSGAALLSALGVSILSRYQRILTGPFKSPVLLPTAVASLIAGVIGITIVWFELPIRNIVASLVIGMAAGGVAAALGGRLKYRVK